MIESDSTAVCERPSHIYGEILSQNMYAAKDALPSAGTFLMQAAAVGALEGFFSIANGMLSHPQNGYNFFLMLYLPAYLIDGMLWGALVGSIIWACTYLAGRQLNVIVRMCIGTLVQAALLALLFLSAEPSPYREQISTTHYVIPTSVYLGLGVVFGLVTGSKFEPWSELFRGTTTTPLRSVVAGVSGLVLRVVVIFSLMESVLYVIWQQQRQVQDSEFTIALIAVGHFIAAVVIVFARMPSWLLMQLALIVNFPIILFITDVLTTKATPMWTLAIVYLSIWFVFLLSRLGARS